MIIRSHSTCMQGLKAIYTYGCIWIMTQIPYKKNTQVISATKTETPLGSTSGARQSKPYWRTNHQKPSENRYTTNSIHTRWACSLFSMQSSTADGNIIETSNNQVEFRFWSGLRQQSLLLSQLSSGMLLLESIKTVQAKDAQVNRIPRGEVENHFKNHKHSKMNTRLDQLKLP